MNSSRRDFLKAGATAALAAVLPSPRSAQGAATAEAELLSKPLPAPKPATGDLRLCTFIPRPGEPARVGALTANGRIIDLGAAAKKIGVKLPFDPAQMLSLIAAGGPALDAVRKVVAKATDQGWKPEEIRLLAPIPRLERNIYAVGWNYVEHFKEGAGLRPPEQKEMPEHPTFFSKAAHVVNGPYDPIPFDPAVSTMIDWEGELAVVIGRRGRNIPEAKSLEHVFGYTVINDTTARDLQQKKHGGQWFKGKSLDGHGPMGPWIITAGEIDQGKLHILTRINGEVMQDASTEQMYFKVPRIIAELSMGLTLEPGDIIATGTPPGVGYARKPPIFLKPGDVMETEIVGIGTIRNTIAAPAGT
ncbi:2-keto-4-pentenoate hydratase [Verrucomicrobia bacterium SCGC AG-212-E04]|nr:2-keto-4-pentenoate hydratase [Verrucomicrobia bacterium SCGC AG-212-E04]